MTVEVGKKNIRAKRAGGEWQTYRAEAHLQAVVGDVVLFMITVDNGAAN